jgi:prepilin-type N-terminal cleavage/methylation domain-containing protein
MKRIHQIRVDGRGPVGRWHRPQAFSLVELLVVIGIIAILAALLLPVLNRAKSQSAKAVDNSNLHEVLTAIHIYTGDYHDLLTWPNWDYGSAMPDGSARPGWLYAPNLSDNGTNAFIAQAGLLWDILHGGKIFLCPADRPDQSYPSAHGGPPTQRDQQLSSYIMNGAVIGFRSGYHSNAPAVKISQMQPADCILFEGDDRFAFSFNDGSSWPSEGISLRHQNGGMIASADGSSSYVRQPGWESEVQYPGRNRLWCYPNATNGGDPVYGHVIFR